MAGSQVLMDVQGGVVTVTLNSPKTLNALNMDLVMELIETLDEIAANPDLKACVMTGAGRAFCAGADLNPSSTVQENPDKRAESVRQGMQNGFNQLIKKFVKLPIPTVSAINGIAAGGGYGLALSGDILLAAQSAKFIQVFAPQLGIIPDMGASWYAPRALGRAKAMAAAYLGDPMSASEAADAGLIWKAVPDEELMGEAMSIAARLAAGPTKAYPQVRKAFDLAFQQDLFTHLDYEGDVQPGLIATEDFLEGVHAFQQKRKPKFKGR